MEVPFLVCHTVHEHRKQILVNAEFFVYLVKILVLPFHKHIERFLCHYHLHLIRLYPAGVGNKIYVISFC